MNKPYHTSLFIFRRDFRLDDNTGLAEAVRLSEQVLPCFIFNPLQLDSNEFMAESVAELSGEIASRGGKLHTFRGEPSQILAQLIDRTEIKAVFVNRDYTPYAIARDAALAEICANRGIEFRQCADALLTEPEQVLKADGTPYTVFTPFCRKARSFEVRMPRKLADVRFAEGSLVGTLNEIPRELPGASAGTEYPGGRAAGLKQIEQISGLADYARERDLPALKGTSRLSPHHKFGTVSIREVLQRIVVDHGEEHPLIGELYWRDFFTHIACHFPHVFGLAFHRRFDRMEWNGDNDAFACWCEGRTGFPIVDAGMRELNETGFMHNRVRMITASFLIKDLHIDWRRGEKYFAQRLVDYDPSVNNGNWQWAASTGCDAVPYFRIFNPWLQQKRFDPEAVYIKRWVKELSRCEAREIHAGESQKLPGYPVPMVDHRVEAERSKQMYGRLNREYKGVVA
jgi:deoxyribodipyrimidine photo-lyase